MSKKQQIAALERRTSNLLASLECTDAHLRTMERRVAALEEDAECTQSESDLRTRLVQALMDALAEGDPKLYIGVGDRELKIGW